MGRGHGDKLATRLREAVTAHLDGTSHMANAARLGVARSTWWRWRQRPEFKNACRAEFSRRVVAAVKDLGGVA